MIRVKTESVNTSSSENLGLATPINARTMLAIILGDYVYVYFP